MREVFYEPLKYWVSGGPLLIPLAGVCFAIWLHFLRMRQRLIRALAECEEAENEVGAAYPGNGFDELRRRFPVQGPAVRAMIGRALKAVSGGASVGMAFDREGRRELARLERNVVILIALTGMAPLLGLLGTVMGMIETFDAVGTLAGDTMDRVASGISRALITTQFGLVVAIPGVFGLGRVRRLLGEIEVRLASVRTHLLLTVEGMMHPGAHGAPPS